MAARDVTYSFLDNGRIADLLPGLNPDRFFSPVRYTTRHAPAPTQLPWEPESPLACCVSPLHMGLFGRSKPATHFPTVNGIRLDGSPVVLPRDLPGPATLLIVSFRDAQDLLSDQWARLIERLQSTYGHQLAALELPVVAKSLKLFGGLATLGIQSQVDTEAERERTLPIFVDKTVFCKTLHCSNQGDVYVFLVDQEGRIAWRGDGGLDMDTISDLESSVQALIGTPPSPSGAS